MNFIAWFHRYAKWDTIGWLAIIGVGAYWEITGAVSKRRTTFTDLVRSVIQVSSPWYLSWGWWVRAIVLGVLFWHFCIAKANFDH